MERLAILVESIWTILIEKSNLRRAAWATSEPKDKWVSFGVIL